MKFEVLKRSHLKRNIIIGVIVIFIISAVILNFTRAKYRVTQSIPLVSGTINYTKADLNVVAMYQENESGSYDSIDAVPKSGYALNKEKSYCEVAGVKDSSINMIYENGIVNVGVKKKGTITTYYGGYIRLITKKAPTFECAEKNDLYTTNGSSQGNQVLTYPIGLITADEVAYAGGVNGLNNTSYYLYTGQYYWTMSPFVYFSGYATVFDVTSNGYLDYSNVNGTHSVRPVINIKSDVTISSGNGTASNPYVIAT